MRERVWTTLQSFPYTTIPCSPRSLLCSSMCGAQWGSEWILLHRGSNGSLSLSPEWATLVTHMGTRQWCGGGGRWRPGPGGGSQRRLEYGAYMPFVTPPSEYQTATNDNIKLVPVLLLNYSYREVLTSNDNNTLIIRQQTMHNN